LFLSVKKLIAVAPLSVTAFSGDRLEKEQGCGSDTGASGDGSHIANDYR